jgi:hypothetical protein
MCVSYFVTPNLLSSAASSKHTAILQFCLMNSIAVHLCMYVGSTRRCARAVIFDTCCSKPRDHRAECCGLRDWSCGILACVADSFCYKCKLYVCLLTNMQTVCGDCQRCSALLQHALLPLTAGTAGGGVSVDCGWHIDCTYDCNACAAWTGPTRSVTTCGRSFVCATVAAAWSTAQQGGSCAAL